MGKRADRKTLAELIARAGYQDAFLGEESASVPCVASGAMPPDGVELRIAEGLAFCRSCDLRTSAVEYLWRSVDAKKPFAPARETALAVGEPGAVALGELPPVPDGAAAGEQFLPGDTRQPEAIAAAQGYGSQQVTARGPRTRGSAGETAIIALLAIACLFAGLMAAGLSGWANFQAFGAMVDDPIQSQVWAWTGVIASVCSFGGFTFVYWHFANGRPKEGLRAIVFALAGAATSVVGTEMFMANTDLARQAEADAAMARRPLIEAQIEAWRTQLDGIPADIRTIDGLEAYIAEVERVERTHQKPYRDAKIELGQARRRAELEAQIADATAELMGTGEDPLASPPAPRRPVPSWFFAVMLEVFSSQGTSVGLVALLILLGRNRDREPALPEP